MIFFLKLLTEEQEMVAHLLVPTAGTTVVALLWLKAMETLRDRGVLSANACRKWIHVGTGPL